MEKTCTGCGQTKSLMYFYGQADHKDGFTSRCKDCIDAKNRRWRSANRDKVKEYNRKYPSRQPDALWISHIMRKYGLTEDEFVKLSVQQGESCAICLQPESKDRRLSVDHDHETGEVRGLLCDDCNNGLGRFKDDPDRLGRAVSYLGG